MARLITVLNEWFPPLLLWPGGEDDSFTVFIYAEVLIGWVHILGLVVVCF